MEMKSILFYGDSNTYGYDPCGGRYPEKEIWTGRLAEKTDGKWKILVNAMNGREIPADPGGRRRLLDLLRKAKEEKGVDWLGIMLGTNDLIYVREPRAVNTAGRMEVLVADIRREIPDLSILLMAPPAIGSYDSADPELAMLHEESICLGSLYTALSQRYQTACVCTAGWFVPLAFDEVHLSGEGHRVFAERMAEILEKLLP